MKKEIKLEGDQPLYLMELLQYATAIYEHCRPIDEGIREKRMQAARQIIADFYLEGDTKTAQATIDFYNRLEHPETEKFNPYPEDLEEPLGSVTDEADGCELPFDD